MIMHFPNLLSAMEYLRAQQYRIHFDHYWIKDNSIATIHEVKHAPVVMVAIADMKG